MSTFETALFAAMVFGAILLLSVAIIIPTVGTGAQANRKMRKRIDRLLHGKDSGNASLIRDDVNTSLGRAESSWLNHPRLRSLELTLQQAGMTVSVPRFLFFAVTLAVVVFAVVLVVFNYLLLATVCGCVALLLPFIRMRRRRKQRLDRFEEQLAEALDIMSRALKAGHPFNETLNFVAEEMGDPIATEFSRVFSDINYGMQSKVAFHALMQRVPSVSLHTLVTAVLIQQESGGALAEILEKVSYVIRGRFKLQRKLRTLSAEGRMSAWILSLLPFVLAGMLMVVSPEYLPVLTREPAGQKLIMAAFGLLAVGILWIRKIINIRV